MSKDNTILILPIRGGFLVRNIQAEEYLRYEPDYCPPNFTPTEHQDCYYNKKSVLDYYINPISEETFWTNPDKYQNKSVFCQLESGADNVAQKMDDLERDYMGWGAEYGVCQEEYIFDFPVGNFLSKSCAN